ncbi:MAG: hypothetical protein U9P80_07710 [Thermodesulfobacteriota bacterium]|nr:hypothetical protein [Thermodesulfobacteriota bacterium]
MVWRHLNGRSIMGGDKFIERIRGMIEEREESREVVRKERLVGRPELRESFFKEGGEIKILRSGIG